MRDTADPDVHQDDSPAPEPGDPPRAVPEPEPSGQEPDDPQPVRVAPGPVIAMTAETITAAGAGLWHVAGWTGVALGAASVAGAGAAAVAGRHRSPWRTGSWSASRSWRAPAPRLGSPGRVGGSPRRSRAGMPSVGGSGGRRGAGSRPGSRAGGSPRRAGSRGFPGAGKRSPGPGRRGGRAAATPVLRGTGTTARRAARASGRALDRAAGTASRGRAAARAARNAKHGGGTSKGAARAARAALRDTHGTTSTRGRWRRWLGSLAWGTAAWAYGQAHDWNTSVTAALRGLFAVRRGDTTDGPERPRIETTVDRPTSPAGTDSTRGADTMARRGGGGAPQFVHQAEELADAFRRYEPPPGAGGMVQMYADVGMLPDALDSISTGLNILADRCRNELPLHAAIAELVHELAKAQAHMASIASELRPAIERLHEPEMTRARAPRPSEDRWNVA